MNCGRNAAKKIAVLGFSSATRKPSRKILPGDAARGAAAASSVRGARSVCTPSQTRYSAPAIFTIVNATEETARIAARPIAAATALPRLPSATPATEASPLRRPCTRLRVTM
jgi:hypothetical protein